MKKKKLTAAYSAALLLIALFSFVTRGTAATNYPLNTPQGLALDASGNLYVANTGSSQVLVYNPSYVQLPARTITHNIVNPSSLAFDGNGNLWVGNGGNNTLTKYGPLGALKGTLDVGGAPYAIAIDGLGDLWVETDFATVSVYIDYSSQYSPTPFVTFSNSADAFTGLATYQGNAAIGTNIGTQVREIAIQLSGQYSLYDLTETGFVMAYDTAGNLYSGNIDSTLSISPANTGQTEPLAQLGFFPSGIAVDSTRGRIYVASLDYNKIAVYNTSGTLLHTIE